MIPPLTPARSTRALLLFVLSLFFVFPSLAQNRTLRVENAGPGKQAVTLDAHLAEHLSMYEVVTVAGLDGLAAAAPRTLDFDLGALLPDVLTLDKVSITGPGSRFVVMTDDGEQQITPTIAVYRAALPDGGWMNVTVQKNGVQGVIRMKDDTYLIQPVGDSQAHILYAMHDLKQGTAACGTETDDISSGLLHMVEAVDWSDFDAAMPSLGKAFTSQATYTAELAVESDYELFLRFNEDADAATAHLLGLIASVNAVYEAELGITLEVVYTRVWAVENDPYTLRGFSVAGEFQSYWNENMTGVERDMAVLITADKLAGGIATIDFMCNTSTAYAATGETINVIAHELGHLFGSNHTHDAIWAAGTGGELGQIDTCGGLKGSGSAIVPTEGTIMSYCEYSALTFHPLVRSIIKARSEQALCLGGLGSRALTNSLSGQIREDGTPLQGVAVSVRSTDGTTTQSTQTGADGTYSFTLPHDSYLVSAEENGNRLTDPFNGTNAMFAVVGGVDVTAANFSSFQFAPDVNEPNDTIAQTTASISRGDAAQSLSFHSASDRDYFRMDVVAGEKYFIDVRPTSNNIFFTPSVSIRDGNDQLVYEDAVGRDLFVWEPETSGTFYLLIFPANGPNTYSVSVTEPLLEQETLSTVDPLYEGEATWADVDADGDMDLVLAGKEGPLVSDAYLRFYRNDNGTLVLADSFEKPCNPTHPNGTICDRMTWGDVNNDGQPDLFTVTASGGEYIRLNDNGRFPTSTALPHERWPQTSMFGDLGDYDLDGDLDALINERYLVGQVNNQEVYANRFLIYNNDGGVFTQADIAMTGLFEGYGGWTDIDQDGDLDILASGRDVVTNGADVSLVPVVRLFRQENGVFVESPHTIEPLRMQDRDMALGDIDNDGDEDLAMFAIRDAVGSPVALIYRNNGGWFDLEAELDLGTYGSDLDFSDYDQDGDLDLAVSGMTGSSATVTMLYTNENGAFVLSPYTALFSGVVGVTTWGDVDSNGSPDLFLMGYNSALGSGASTGTAGSYLIRNSFAATNAAPSVPGGLATVEGEYSWFTLSWLRAQDDTTPSAALTYNVRIGSTPGGVDVLSPLSNAQTGKTYVKDRGNSGSLTSRVIKGLTPGQTYYWSVQSVDNSFEGSGWAPEQSFVATSSLAVSNDTAQTDEDTAVSVSVLSNDGGANLSVSGVVAPANGTVVIESDNTITYTPDADYNGTDTFSYTVTDGLASLNGTVSVTVAAVNDVPQGQQVTAPEPGSGVVIEGAPETTLRIAWDPATDVDGDPVTYTWEASAVPAFGTLLLSVPAGSETEVTLTYAALASLLTANGVAFGEGLLLFHRVRATDGTAESASASVQVFMTLQSVVSMVVENDTAETPEDVPIVVDVLANDTGGNLRVTGTTNPANGFVQVLSANEIMYYPQLDFNGTDTFSYTATDGTTELTAMVTVAVTAVNDAPGTPSISSPEAGSAVVIEGAPETSFRVNWNASVDAENDPVTYTWELATTALFDTILLSVDTGLQPEVELTYGAVATLLTANGIQLGQDVELYHRVRATDGTDESVSEPFSVTLTRAAIVSTEQVGIPVDFELAQNFPNPFNPTTTIRFGLPVAAHVYLTVHDSMGRTVRVLVDGSRGAGWHGVPLDASRLPSGTYFYRIHTGTHSTVRSLVVLK